MSKRLRGFSNTKYEKWLKEGRGQGEGKDYKPWLTIQDVPSQGRCTRIRGIKTGRQHDLFSDNELNYFCILEYSDEVIDIREQFPLLNIEETMHIADELGIKHHIDPQTKEPIVITTDFVITVQEDGKKKIIARTIKPYNDLHNERQMCKFQIEKRYWDMKEIDWGIVTENEINKTLAKNISEIHGFYDLESVKGFENISENQIFYLLSAFKNEITGNDIIVRDVAARFDEKMYLEPGTAISIYKHLLMSSQIQINIINKINIDFPQIIRPYLRVANVGDAI